MRNILTHERGVGDLFRLLALSLAIFIGVVATAATAGAQDQTVLGVSLGTIKIEPQQNCGTGGQPAYVVTIPYTASSPEGVIFVGGEVLTDKGNIARDKVFDGSETTISGEFVLPVMTDTRPTTATVTVSVVDREQESVLVKEAVSFPALTECPQQDPVLEFDAFSLSGEVCPDPAQVTASLEVKNYQFSDGDKTSAVAIGPGGEEFAGKVTFASVPDTANSTGAVTVDLPPTAPAGDYELVVSVPRPDGSSGSGPVTAKTPFTVKTGSGTCTSDGTITLSNVAQSKAVCPESATITADVKVEDADDVVPDLTATLISKSNDSVVFSGGGKLTPVSGQSSLAGSVSIDIPATTPAGDYALEVTATIDPGSDYLIPLTTKQTVTIEAASKDCADTAAPSVSIGEIKLPARVCPEEVFAGAVVSAFDAGGLREMFLQVEVAPGIFAIGGNYGLQGSKQTLNVPVQLPVESSAKKYTVIATVTDTVGLSGTASVDVTVTPSTDCATSTATPTPTPTPGVAKPTATPGVAKPTATPVVASTATPVPTKDAKPTPTKGPAPKPTPAKGGGLANTGTTVSLLTMIGLGLIGAGTVAVMARRSTE